MLMNSLETYENFRVQECLIDSPKVVFIFTAMATKIGWYRLSIRRLQRRGYSCIVYDYPTAMTRNEASLERWRLFFEQIVADAQSRLHRLEQNGATNFYAYGVSMGTLVANKLTRETAEIHHVVLNLTYGDVARNVWTFWGINEAKQVFMQQGLNEADLRKHLKYADPIVNAKGLQGKKVMLHLARRDRILPYTQTKKTLEAFQAARLDLTYKENKYLGHFFGAIKNMMDIRAIDEFFTRPPK